ncbi:hypothetical protein X975_12135, partial [Stegodyphus mimosarum]
MRASHMLLCASLVVFFAHLTVNGQFFTKTGSSIPRMGRRSDSALPNLVRRIARTLRFVVEMVQEYDQDSNGELNPEELMGIPFIQNAVRNYLDERELRGQYPIASGKETSQPSSDGQRRQIYNEHLIM